MDTRIDFLYLSEADMIAAGVTDMRGCMDTMIEMYKLFVAGDYVMGGANHNSHGLMLDFPVTSAFPNMPVAGPDRRFAAMPSYLGGDFDVAGMKWYGSNSATCCLWTSYGLRAPKACLARSTSTCCPTRTRERLWPSCRATC